MKICSYYKPFAAMLLIALAGCGSHPEVVEVTDQAMRSPYRPPVKLNATSEDRFQLALRASRSAEADDAPQMTAQQMQEQPQLFAWDMPADWREVDPTPMRLVNLRFGESSECYLTVLSGTGGGIDANVNRWRAQMGLDAIDDAAIATLPRMSLFGRDAIVLDVEGTFSGMGGGVPQDGYRLIGALVEHGGRSVFVKMVGPRYEIDPQADNFETFLGSIRLADAAMQNSSTSASLSGGGSHIDVGGLGWQEPTGWERGGERPMRLVTYNAGETECYVTILGTGGGGLLANLNRWLAQFGKEPMDELAIADLPAIEMLGQQAPLLEAVGDFTGMDGTATPDQGLLAVAVMLPDKSVFVKMTGPADAVAEQRDAFIAFCNSLHGH